MIPPKVSLPSPFDTVPPKAALAAYPDFSSSSNDFCTGANPHRYASVPKNLTVDMTERDCSATHANGNARPPYTTLTISVTNV